MPSFFGGAEPDAENIVKTNEKTKFNHEEDMLKEYLIRFEDLEAKI